MTTSTAPQIRKRATDEGWYFYSPTATKRTLLACLQGTARTFWKAASIGGEQEAGFEQAFSSLAYAYLKDKSPRLLDFIIGFQLVDRNEDNTKAMGVFGFKVGEQWLYAPTFFLNGDLKGHELLYIKQQDAFIPMKENWVNYLISRKPHVLGEGSAKDTHQLGGMPSDISKLSHPPSAAKYAADAAFRPGMQGWCKDFLPFIGAAAVAGKTDIDRVFTKHASLNEKLSLKSFLTEDISLLKGAFDLYCAYPLIKKGFDTFYGADFFEKAALELKAKEASLVGRRPTLQKQAAPKWQGASLIPDWKPTDPIKSGALQIFYADAEMAKAKARAAEKTAGVFDDLFKAAEQSDKPLKVDEDNTAPGGITVNKAELDDAERAKLLHDGVLIKDHRDPHATSMVYNTQVRVELVNPGESGLYEVLEKPGDFDMMLVGVNPQTNRGGENFATVVRLSDPKNWLNTHPTNLWVKCNSAPDKPKFKEWFDKLEGTESLKKDGTYMVVGPNGTCSTPFVVNDDLEDKTFRVSFRDYCEFGNDRPRGLPRYDGLNRWEKYDTDYGYVSTYNAILRLNEREGTKLRATAGELNVPSNFKVFKIEDPPKPKKKDDGTLLGCWPPTLAERSDPKKPIKPGNIGDIQLMFHEKTSSLKLMDLGGEVVVKHPWGEARLTKTAALVHLVRDHGFTEFTVRQMLKEAAVKKTMTYRVKYAEPSQSALAGGPSAPAFPQPHTGMERVGPGAVPSIYPQDQMTQIPEMNSGQTDPTIYDPFYQPDQGAMQVAQSAAQGGQKEVFDTAMISGMLKAVRQDSLVDRYLGDLMKALDKIGRILFMFYWHQEEFEDRYGKQDLPELEDSLRNAFEVLGDVCLFLKEKQVGNFQELQGVGDPNIEAAARN